MLEVSKALPYQGTSIMKQLIDIECLLDFGRHFNHVVYLNSHQNVWKKKAHVLICQILRSWSQSL